MWTQVRGHKHGETIGSVDVGRKARAVAVAAIAVTVAGSAEDGTARRRRRSRRSRIGDATELAGGLEYANVQGTRVNYLDGNTSNDRCADNDDSGVAEITEAE